MSRQVLISLYEKLLIILNFKLIYPTYLKPRVCFCWQKLREMVKHIILLILKTFSKI